MPEGRRSCPRGANPLDIANEYECRLSPSLSAKIPAPDRLAIHNVVPEYHVRVGSNRSHRI